MFDLNNINSHGLFSNYEEYEGNENASIILTEKFKIKSNNITPRKP